MSIFVPDELQFEPTLLRWSAIETDESTTRGGRMPVIREPQARDAVIERFAIRLPTEVTALDTIRLWLEFEISGWSTDGADCFLPVPVLEIDSQDPDEQQLFAVELLLPEGRNLVQGFPTGLDQEPASPDSTRVTYRLDSFPVVPRFVRFALVHGAPPVWTVARLADGITVTVLLVLLALAWKRFRSLPE